MIVYIVLACMIMALGLYATIKKMEDISDN